jgi:hypothetical protein
MPQRGVLEMIWLVNFIDRFRAFCNGMREFRSDLTVHYDWPLIEWYDRGRELMHIITAREYES